MKQRRGLKAKMAVVPPPQVINTNITPTFILLLLLFPTFALMLLSLPHDHHFPLIQRNYTNTLPISALYKRFESLSQNQIGKLHCFPVATPHPTYKQQCCDVEGQVTCLPNVIVLGSQKAGTTALFSYLLLHPEIRTGAKKEMHLFDFDKNYNYLTDLLPVLLPQNDDVKSAAQQVTVDATPSYIADPKTCVRMSRMISEDARMVLLLRHPVQRTWSDLQMKSRRIAFQTNFLHQMLPTYFHELKMCMVMCLNTPEQCGNAYQFKQCLPSELAAHGRTATFFKWMQQNTKQQLIEFMNTCLQRKDQTSKCFHPGGKYFERILRERMPILPQTLFDEGTRLNRTLHKCEGFDCFPQTPMMSDVSANHLFRSLYFIHIQHCFSFLDRNNLMIVNSEDLLNEPHRVLVEIFNHVGVSTTDSALMSRMAALSPQQLHEAFQQKYPDFENISGWSKIMVQQSLELTKEMREYMTEFFRPWNKRLFQEISMKPWKGWEV